MIQVAAEQVPPPDLMVLPDGCDFGGPSTPTAVHQAHCVAVRETLAWKAREWGVYIAAGLHSFVDESYVPNTVLFDPDGDVVARSKRLGDPASGEFGMSDNCCATPVGAISVYRIDRDSDSDVWSRFQGNQAIHVVGGFHSASDAQRRAFEEYMTGLETGESSSSAFYWTAVTGASLRAKKTNKECDHSFIRSSDGRVLAIASESTETSVSAEMPLALCNDSD